MVRECNIQPGAAPAGRKAEVKRGYGQGGREGRQGASQRPALCRPVQHCLLVVLFLLLLMHGSLVEQGRQRLQRGKALVVPMGLHTAYDVTRLINTAL